MTETSTKNVNSVINKACSTEDVVCFSDDLDANDRQFYLEIFSNLSSIQLLPKQETVLKIINYSRMRSKASVLNKKQI